MFEFDNASIRKLATTSMRLNVILFVTLALALLSISTSYWAFSRLIQEEREKIDYHYTRLMTNIRAHEDFLTGVARKGDEATAQLDKEVIPLQSRLLSSRSGVNTYEGRSFSFATPFTLTVDQEDDQAGFIQGAFSIGVLLTNFYNSFWSTSQYSSPQSFVFDLDTPFSLAIPAMGFFPDRYLFKADDNLPLIEDLRQQLARQSMDVTNVHIRWITQGGQDKDVNGDEMLLGFIAFNASNKIWLKDRYADQLVAITVLDLSTVSKVVGENVFDYLELIPPGGEPLFNSIPEYDRSDNGLNFFLNGLVIKISNTDSDNMGWTALYRIKYERFMQYAKWQLMVLISLLLANILAGLLAFRWYLKKVVLPARNAYQNVSESDSFGRIVIQNIPVAICILRRDDLQVLLVNQMAQQMLGDAETIGQLWTQWNISSAIPLESPVTCIVSIDDDRFLQLSYVAAHYEEEDVLLCAFNDLTEHKRAEKALADAKQLADAASDAKMRFLATMTHEIRTPLYGVLGTLELFALTQLSEQQREYLKTLQESSSSLLQLLSDVLDVSKIEAGQMILEPTQFCPLDIVEVVLKQYSEAAIAKNLQLYTCIDPDVPGLLYGDAARIRQILVNLVNNAIKFTDVGRIVVRLRMVRRKNDQVDLEWQVADTGIGIPLSQHSRLFEPFHQAHVQQHTVSGTGLGLAISWQLIKLMKGELRVVSDVGLGSSFIMALRLRVISDVIPRNNCALPNETVYVRGPNKELVANVCAWFKSWGAKALTDDQFGAIDDAQVDLNANTMILVDLFPSRLSQIEWKGPRLLCSPEYTHDPQRTPEGWCINLFAIRCIGKTAMRARGLVLEPDCETPPQRTHKFDLNILLAEDNAINQILLKEQLEELGCRVVPCSNGQEVLQRWNDDEFDVLLTDVNMPLMNGYELAMALRERHIDIPIIGITANAMREKGERCLEVGMNAWLTKPVTLKVLGDTLSRVMGIRSEVDAAEDGEHEVSSPVVEATESVQTGPSLQVPERMRDLFIKTMREDVQTTRQAFTENDMAKARLMFHRMQGALAMVDAQHLTTLCCRIEEQMLNQALTDELIAQAKKILDEIDSALDEL